MPLLPLRALPVNDGGPLSIRVEVRPNYTALFVRRESDKKTWSCKVRSIQEIRAPSEEAHALDVNAVLTCLYHGVGYDATSLHALSCGAPLELTRREVAFAQPETRADGHYRLIMRISMRSAATATPTAMSVATADATADHVVPVVEIPDQDMVFGLNFAPSDANVEIPPFEGGWQRASVRVYAMMMMQLESIERN